MMRVLALTNLYPNPYQPHRAAFNRQQFDALAAEHQVQVIAPIAWTGEWSARRRALPALAADRRQVRGKITVHHPRYAFTPKVLRGLYGWFLVQSIRGCFRKAVRDFRPDVVVGCWAYPDGWAAVQLARECGLPVAVKIHGSDVLAIDDQPARRRRTAQALSAADAVIAVSRDLGDKAVMLGVDRSRVHVVYNGIDRALFSPGPREPARRQIGVTHAEPLILFVGNLVPVKGLDVLMEAVSLVARDGAPFQCAIAGNGHLKADLESQIRTFGLGARVRLVGQIPQERLPHWYRAANLVVLPSRSEGVPNVLLEAAACGTPCVATRVGGIPEVLHDGDLVPPGDAAALAARITAFLRGQPSRHGGVRHTPGSWSDSARSLAAILEGIRHAAAAARAG